MNIESIINEFAKDDLIYYFVPLFLLAMILEMIYNHHKKLSLYEKADTKASLWMMLLVSIVDLTPKFLFFIIFYQLHNYSPFADIIVRQWWAWLILFFADDFIYYWFHRLNHEIRLFWAGHVSHHSAIRMNFGTALRQGIGERVHKYLFWLPLPLLGFDPLMVFTVMSVNLFYQFWVHTELIHKLPNWFEFIFNTPSHHRVHHASNIRYLDCNHAGVFIIWDRLFGTFSKEMKDEKPIYGLTENITSTKPVFVATHEYQSIFNDVLRANNWKDRFKTLLMAPGWSFDGPDKRSKTLRAKLKTADRHI